LQIAALKLRFGRVYEEDTSTNAEGAESKPPKSGATSGSHGRSQKAQSFGCRQTRQSLALARHTKAALAKIKAAHRGGNSANT
jgi:hypothetical protein